VKKSPAALVRRARRIFRSGHTEPAAFLEVERAESRFYLDYLCEGMTVFDVGANVGELTLLFSKFVGAEGHVHAFEPGSEAFARLTAVCRATARRNVTLNHLALSDRVGSLSLYVYDEAHLGWSSPAVRPLENYGINVAPPTAEDVEATTLDAYCERNGIRRIDLLKIDVEGAEYQVLLGARRMLQRQTVGCIVFEFGQTTFDMGNDPTEIEAYFKELGYGLRNVVAGDKVFPGREGAASACYSMHVATPAG
jgi:FkbM family methyltransferase